MILHSGCCLGFWQRLGGILFKGKRTNCLCLISRCVWNVDYIILRLDFYPYFPHIEVNLRESGYCITRYEKLISKQKCRLKIFQSLKESCWDCLRNENVWACRVKNGLNLLTELKGICLISASEPNSFCLSCPQNCINPGHFKSSVHQLDLLQILYTRYQAKINISKVQVPLGNRVSFIKNAAHQTLVYWSLIWNE